jgi:hypothetical protein
MSRQRHGQAAARAASILFAAGQRCDSPQFQAVSGRIRVPAPAAIGPGSRPARVLGDKAYASAAE